MNGQTAEAIRSTRAIASHLWRAAFVGFTLLLFGSSAWLVVRAREVAQAGDADSRSRARFEAIWSSVAEGQRAADVIARMGRPDDERVVSERIPDCSGTCGAAALPCEQFHICVQEYEWRSEPEPQSSTVYSVCADADGIVRRQSTGMSFNLASVGDWYGSADVVAWAIGSLLFGLPLAALLMAKRRMKPYRTMSLR